MSTPQSIISVCSGVKLNNRYEHTIYWPSLEAQEAYFAGKVVKTFSGYTFLRKSWSIKVQSTMEEARRWSYLFFQNGLGKTYYYFINNIEYVNDNTVELFLELDVMQTYARDYELLRCFVERQHSKTDRIGDNLMDEGLELGEFVVANTQDVSLHHLCIMVLSTFDVNNVTVDEGVFSDDVIKGTAKGRIINGVFTGLGLYAVRTIDAAKLNTELQRFDELGISDGIINMWMYPTDMVELEGDVPWESDAVFKPVKTVVDDTCEVDNPDKLAGNYIPTNKKLYTFPFNFMYATNNNGAAATYRYEKFGDPNNCMFGLRGTPMPDGGVKMYPLNYNGEQHAYEEGLSLTNYPSCAWSQDVYKLWLAQNQNQQALQTGAAALQIVAGTVTTVATGGAGAAIGAGQIMSGVSTIASLMAQKADKEIQPPQARGNVSSSLNIAAGFGSFTFKQKSVSNEVAAAIDGYFDLYGYKHHQLKIPEPHVRENWTYIKTVGCHIGANFAGEDIAKIESIFDKGITFWVNGDNIGKYNLSNRPLAEL